MISCCVDARRVYIAYLDSVHFFRPRQYRTEVYHEILIGYLDYVKSIGSVNTNKLHYCEAHLGHKLLHCSDVCLRLLVSTNLHITRTLRFETVVV